MELCKVTTWLLWDYGIYNDNVRNVPFLSSESFPIIKPPSIPLIKKEKEIQYKNLVKINIRNAPTIPASKTYEINMGNFESGYPEYIL